MVWIDIYVLVASLILKELVALYGIKTVEVAPVKTMFPLKVDVDEDLKVPKASKV